MWKILNRILQNIGNSHNRSHEQKRKIYTAIARFFMSQIKQFHCFNFVQTFNLWQTKKGYPTCSRLLYNVEKIGEKSIGHSKYLSKNLMSVVITRVHWGFFFAFILKRKQESHGKEDWERVGRHVGGQQHHVVKSNQDLISYQ